ncbi:Protein kinase interacting factor [Trabala vishnou gigantina nucleopolyhedrovirus]|uniref:Protein kinase interacting factor n=1 Tax=Trabala vishnou gigantina nucleopolyhedrovirus TaxID=2863583 RepID=UPI002481AAA8|nr:Protein kinase interacting factor [Trabala vishnou gigantina nucleopolyhedrovirus]QYC92740.1 Protein kinase interacting factor [Trabala vishnou gigantina nucleopolyhedrovirus]
MNDHIMTLRHKRDKYREQYQSKAVMYFKKSGAALDHNYVREMYVMSATLFGLDEQVYSIENDATTKNDKLNFINNLNELGLDKETIETIYNTIDHVCIMSHYNVNADSWVLVNNKMTNNDASDESTKNVYTILVRNAKKFTNVLVQFVNKRNAYRKKENDILLDELVLLKSTLIKHLCIIQKLSEFKPIVMSITNKHK